MAQINLKEKFKKAAEVICKQGMVQFPVNDTSLPLFLPSAAQSARRPLQHGCTGAELFYLR
jgi:hypothetical protein